MLDNLAKIFRYELYFLLNLLCRSSESIFIKFSTQFVSISLINKIVFLSNKYTVNVYRGLRGVLRYRVDLTGYPSNHFTACRLNGRVSPVYAG